MNISVIGPGAMGMLFGGYLSAKNNVTLIGRDSARMDMIKDNGIVIREADGREKTYSVNAVSSTESMEQADIAVIFTKSYNSEEALKGCRSIIGDNTILITLQNGAGNEDILKKYASEENIIIGTTQQGSYRTGDNSVCHSGGGDTAFGVICGSASRFEKISDVFCECGFPCMVSDDIGYMIWNKLMINASSSVVSGLLQTTQGYAADNEYAWSIVCALISEMCAVAAADGCHFDCDSQIKRIYAHLQNAHDGYTSIYADIKAGRKTEVRRINGAVVEKAHKYGIPVPVHETVQNLVLALENR